MPTDLSALLDLLLRWGHILSAIFLMGGTFFMRVALLPAMAELPEKEREEMSDRVRGPWATVVMTSVGLLFLTGMINVVLIMMRYKLAEPTWYYHTLLTVKVVLAIAIFYIASMLTGRSEAAAEWRKSLGFWLNVNITLAILLVLIAGAMRFVGRTPKPPAIDPAGIPAAAPADPGARS